MIKSDIGLVGLAVMGENLALNLEQKGYRVSLYNRLRENSPQAVDSSPIKGKTNISSVHTRPKNLSNH